MPRESGGASREACQVEREEDPGAGGASTKTRRGSACWSRGTAPSDYDVPTPVPNGAHCSEVPRLTEVSNVLQEVGGVIPVIQVIAGRDCIARPRSRLTSGELRFPPRPPTIPRPPVHHPAWYGWDVEGGVGEVEGRDCKGLLTLCYGVWTFSCRRWGASGGF